jgi:hypothetical protein
MPPESGALRTYSRREADVTVLPAGRPESKPTKAWKLVREIFRTDSPPKLEVGACSRAP